MSYRAEHVRIFLASPSDVADERALALRIVGELGYDPSLRGRVTLETIAWDQPKAGTALLANVTPQAAISAGLPRPSECDIVVVILWSRMGTPLPSQYQKSDGSGYLSGTEYEFEDALAACREHGRPFILLYRRVDTPATMLDDPFITEKLAQYQLVKDFFLRFTEKESGALLAGINHYENPSAFAKSLEIHLRQLLERMLRDMPLSSPVSPVGSFTQPVWTGSPFPGLRALSPKDAPIFFGRGYETDALIKRINVPTSRFLAVVGASGSGKSSLVGAGLIPRLQAIPDDTHWLVLNFTPDYLGSGNPFAALGAALLRDLPSINSRGLVGKLQSAPGHLAALLSQVVSTEGQPTRLLVFVDQFEELFTTVEPRLRDGFIESLTQVVQCQYITTIVTLRGDFYGKCVEIPVLAKLLEDSTFPLSAPGVVALLEMISYPAKRAGVQFEDGLVERILEDTGDEPGALPLMAYTLDELYRAAGDGRPITHSAYEALGGVQGAIGKRSEEVFSTLLDDERAELPHVFRELVEVDERGTATRQRARLQDCAQTTAADSLVHALADARLLVLSKDERNEPYVEVAHEALLQSWERLAQWISETEDDLRLLRQVRLATREWEENGRRDDYLWSQERLEPVYEMQYRLQVVFEPSVRDFVRPETDRLLEDFQADNRYFRQRPIIERLAEIGPRSAPILVTCLADAATVSSLNDIKGALRRFGAPAIV